MTTLYFAPGACSIGIHILLEEIGAPFEKHRVDLAKGEQYQPDFVSVNAKSKVPTLVRDDGSVLTEFPAIALWLAWTHPDKKLFPDSVEGKTRVMEAMDYAVATIHMQGFARQFRPTNFGPSESDQDAVKARGKEIAAKGFALMDKKLAGHEYVAGDFSIADTALFYVELWAMRMQNPLPENCKAHFARMLARPSVQRVIASEGLQLPA